jgi:hypothetical protein
LLESNKFIHSDGRKSWSYIVASVGMRNGESVSMRTSYGWSEANSKQQFKTISYRKCKRRLFWKKCWTAHENVARGLTNEELTIVEANLLKYAHLGALNKIITPAPAPAPRPAPRLALAPRLASAPLRANVGLSNVSRGRHAVKNVARRFRRGRRLARALNNVINESQKRLNSADKIDGLAHEFFDVMKLNGVRKQDLVAAVDSIIRGTKSADFDAKIREFVNSPRSGVITHKVNVNVTHKDAKKSLDDVFTIKLTYNGKTFDITSTF